MGWDWHRGLCSSAWVSSVLNPAKGSEPAKAGVPGLVLLLLVEKSLDGHSGGVDFVWMVNFETFLIGLEDHAIGIIFVIRSKIIDCTVACQC